MGHAALNPDRRSPSLTSSSPFKWRHFQPEIILCGVRWYLRYSLSYRGVEALILERGLQVDHTSVFRWVKRYAPELDKRSRPHLKTTNDSSNVADACSSQSFPLVKVAVLSTSPKRAKSRMA
jgi:hypothetical protein